MCDLLTLLDSQLRDLEEQIGKSPDPDSMGLFDRGEFLAGTGFVACQRYLASTYGPHNVPKEIALAVGPYHAGGESYAAIFNAAANFWKHVDEWDIFTPLGVRQQRTVDLIESVTPWSNYTCANLLFELAGQLQFAGLIPKIEDWRKQLDAAQVR